MVGSSQGPFEILDGSFLRLAFDGRKFVALYVLQASSCKLRGSFQRSAIFSAVGKPSLQVRIAPTGAWRGPFLRGRRRLRGAGGRLGRGRKGDHHRSNQEQPKTLAHRANSVALLFPRLPIDPIPTG